MSSFLLDPCNRIHDIKTSSHQRKVSPAVTDQIWPVVFNFLSVDCSVKWLDVFIDWISRICFYYLTSTHKVCKQTTWLVQTTGWLQVVFIKIYILSSPSTVEGGGSYSNNHCWSWHPPLPSVVDPRVRFPSMITKEFLERNLTTSHRISGSNQLHHPTCWVM